MIRWRWWFRKAVLPTPRPNRVAQSIRKAMPPASGWSGVGRRRRFPQGVLEELVEVQGTEAQLPADLVAHVQQGDVAGPYPLGDGSVDVHQGLPEPHAPGGPFGLVQPKGLPSGVDDLRQTLE